MAPSYEAIREKYEAIREKFGSQLLINAPPEVLLQMIESAFQWISEYTLDPSLKQRAQKILKEDYVGKCRSQIKQLIAEVWECNYDMPKNILQCHTAPYCGWYSNWLCLNDPENNITIAEANVILVLDMLYARVVNINSKMSDHGFILRCPIDTINSLACEVTQFYSMVPFDPTSSKKWNFKNGILRNKYSTPELTTPSVVQGSAKTELVKEVSQTMVKILTFSFIDGNIVKVPALISANDLDKIPFAC